MIIDIASVKRNYEKVMRNISIICEKNNRDISEITLIVVTKNNPISLIRELVDLGVKNFGENRDQEASIKATELRELDITWHYIGQLQSKKLKSVLSYSEVIHSLDRKKLIEVWPENSIAKECFLQVNLTSDSNRGGVMPEELVSLAKHANAHPAINIKGVMGIAPLDVSPTEAFKMLQLYSQTLQEIIPEANKISAGMSYDYADAIAYGATHLRIGSAITKY